MKKLRILSTMILSLIASQFISAQDFGDLIKGSAADANYLIKGYTTPAIKTFASGLSQGWYNTADTHKFFGADLTISIAMIGAPSSDKKFTVDNSKLTTIQLDGTSAGKGTIPTFFGSSKNTGQTLSLKSDPSSTTPVPSGVDIPISRIPMPVVHLGFSIPKGTDIKVRFIPTLDLGGSGKLGLFGVAVQHDIKQWLPGVKELPFSLSALVGYTKFSSEVELDDTNKANVGSFDVSSTTIQVLISKKITVLTFYGGVGYDIAKGGLKVKGTYDLGNSQTVTDPINFTSTANAPRLTAGMRLKLGPITFHGDYTVKEYSAITAGFGISVR